MLHSYLTNKQVSCDLVGLYYHQHTILHAIKILLKYNIFKFGDIIVHIGTPAQGS
jgi:hypothetical protein